MLDIESIRKQFPQSTKMLYLDTAATSLKPKRMVEALSHFYLHEYGTIHRGAYSLSQMASQRYFSTRVAIAKFLHATSENEIIFTKNTTESINLVAASFGAFLQEKDEIILSSMEHHSNLVPWQLLAKKKNLTLKFIGANKNGDLDLEEFTSLLSEKTKLIAVAHISNVTGTIHPISYIVEKGHEMGAKILIDGAQAVGHIPVNLQDIGADFYCFSMHKAYGPNGVGVLYGKASILEKMGPYLAGGDMIQKVSFEGATYQKPPSRFEAGTPAIAEVISCKESINLLEEIGMENICRWENFLLEHLLKNLSQIEGVTIIGTPAIRAPIVSFLIEKVHPLDLATFLDIKNIAIRTGHICAEPYLDSLGIHSVARASIGVYTTLEEIKYFCEQLGSIAKQLAVR